jgi:hypothetical protein
MTDCIIMKHLRLEESSSSVNRIAFRIIGVANDPFHKWFWELLRWDLQAFNPILNGDLLFIDATTLPGVADAFDALTGEALGAAEREREAKREIRRFKEDQKRSSIEKFKESQGL